MKPARGRKRATTELTDDIKARLSVIVARHNVSLRNADSVALLWMSKYEDVAAYERLGLSRSTINQIILNVYGRVLKHISIQIVRSKKLTILIDGTTDRKNRSPLAIQMTGIDPENHNEKWFAFFFL
jgi:hypothetical protein